MSGEITTLDELPPEARAAVRRMLDQLAIVMVDRTGGNLTVPIAEIDATGDKWLSFEIVPDRREFTFTVRRKQ